MLHQLRHSDYRPGLALLVLALCVRALVPEGFMPAKGELVELCTEHGLQRMLVDMRTGEFISDEEESGATPACPWSLLLTSLALPALPTAGLAPAPGPADPPRKALAPTTARSTPTPPARAPPRLS